ncbi:MAG: hypothetical protein D6738_11920 [Acidobacteria bacterium]|nr:MAG: hypothetical protein D6738_11920 [Acidobacteriota bacterium]
MGPVLQAGTSGREAVREAFLDLVARIAHDLNNHLATILGKAEIALMVDDPARWRRGIEHGYEAGQRARRAVADLQRVHGWVEAATPDPAPLAEVLELARRLAARSLARLDLEPAISERSGALVDDPAPWALALWRLLSERARSCESAPAEPWTLVAERRADGAVVVAFAHPGVRADASGGPGGTSVPGPRSTAPVRMLVEACGGAVESAGETTRLVLP